MTVFNNKESETPFCIPTEFTLSNEEIGPLVAEANKNLDDEINFHQEEGCFFTDSKELADLINANFAS